MGVGELNNCYEDAELADTIVACGTNALETQTNYFLNHWVPNLRGESAEKKKQQLPDEPHEASRIIFVDPRRALADGETRHRADANQARLVLAKGVEMARREQVKRRPRLPTGGRELALVLAHRALSRRGLA